MARGAGAAGAAGVAVTDATARKYPPSQPGGGGRNVRSLSPPRSPPAGVTSLRSSQARGRRSENRPPPPDATKESAAARSNSSQIRGRRSERGPPPLSAKVEGAARLPSPSSEKDNTVGEEAAVKGDTTSTPAFGSKRRSRSTLKEDSKPEEVS